jgi:hypothetical protein
MPVPLRLSRHRPAAAPDANDASRGGAAGPGTSVCVAATPVGAGAARLRTSVVLLPIRNISGVGGVLTEKVELNL